MDETMDESLPGVRKNHYKYGMKYMKMYETFWINVMYMKTWSVWISENVLVSDYLKYNQAC